MPILLLPFSKNGITAAAGTANETDASRALGRRKIKLVGIAASTETAQALGRRKVKALGIALETDAAQPITRRIAFQFAAETDSARPLGRVKIKLAGFASEADAAQPFGRRKTKALGTALETETAQPIGRRKVRAVNTATETDTARLIGTGNRLGKALETDTARPIGRVHRRTLGIAFEGEIAMPISFTLIPPAYRFSVPTHEEPIRLSHDMPHRPISYYRLTYAPSLVNIGGNWTTIRTPSAELLSGLVDGQDYFRGGYDYVVSQSVADSLAAAGYTSTRI